MFWKTEFTQKMRGSNDFLQESVLMLSVKIVAIFDNLTLLLIIL